MKQVRATVARLLRGIVVLALVLLCALIFGSLAEHFGWRLFSEAGGRIV
jgi:hypothetical protein